ncbi:hypothetical protein [Halalkalibacter krulwichiae]|uniref:Uncharacterized protein n=1 Tax=Halalkalibacter krulwichiae TaxID=199441 RepID=A0A1X9MFF9_9BACI|nr:hypothetical protein [Halalkalibacter krulwichiae]ARK32178.1 hypothetical protein BkAM31D_21295 [Halalkalibacter krulwichiae]
MDFYQQMLIEALSNVELLSVNRTEEIDLLFRAYSLPMYQEV